MEQGIGFLHGEGSVGEPTGVRELGPVEYWRVLRRRRRVAVKTAIGTLVIGLVVLFVLPWKYQSTARLELSFAIVSPLDTLGLPSGVMDQLGTNSDAEMGTEINAMQSEPLMTEAINHFGLFLDPDFVGGWRASENKENSQPWYTRPKEREKEIMKFGKLLNAEVAPKSFDVDYSFSYRDADKARAITDYLVKRYIESRYQARYDTVKQTTQWLTAQLGDFKRVVDQSQQNLAKFARDHQIIDAGGQASGDASGGVAPSSSSSTVDVQRLIDLNHQLVQGQADLLIAEAKYRLSQSQDPAAMSAILKDDILTADSTQLSALQVQVAEARSRLGPHHPHVVELEKQVAQAQEALNRRLDEIRTGYKNDYETALKNENSLQRDTDALTRRTAGRVEDYLQYQVLKGELDSNRTLYQGLTQKLQQAGIAASLQATHVTVLNPPQTPYLLHFPPWKYALPGLLVFSLMMAAVGALVADKVDDSLAMPPDVEHRSGLPVLGVVPRFLLPGQPPPSRGRSKWPAEDADNAARNPSIVTAEPNSPGAEAYRRLRSSPVFSSAGHAQVIVLASPLPEEGTAATSINLATSFAQLGSRVLLVDGDLRKPVLTDRYHLPNSQGLSDLLTTPGLNPESRIVPVGSTNSLGLLPSGVPSAFPGDILETEAAKSLFATLRARFDYIVVSSAPVLAANDARIFGRYADLLLLVVRARKTPGEALHYAADLLREGGSPVKGVVMNDLAVDEPEYLYSPFAYLRNKKNRKG
jgi:succinoglycan biosynthesis transport protein ExoP